MISATCLFIGGVLGYLMAWATQRDDARFWKGQSDFWHNSSKGWMDRALAALDEPPPPRFKIWPLLLRIAPRTKLSELSDALFDQGWCVDMVGIERIESPDESTPDTVAEASGENAPGPQHTETVIGR